MLFEIKEDCKLEDVMFMKPALLILFTRTALFCSVNKLPLKITSLFSDRDNVKAVSKTHEQHRAVDISTLGWTNQQIHRFVYLINRDYADIAAISYSDMKPRAAIYHDAGFGQHIHLQVKPNADIGKYISN